MRKSRLWAVPLAAAPLLAISVAPIASAAPSDSAPADDCPAVELIIAGSESSEKESETLANVVDRSVASTTDSVSLHVIDTNHPVNFDGADQQVEANPVANQSDDKAEEKTEEKKVDDEKHDKAEENTDTEGKDKADEGADEAEAAPAKKTVKKPFPEPTEVAGKDDPRRNGNAVNLTDAFEEEYFADTDEGKDKDDKTLDPTDELEGGPAFEADVPKVKSGNVSNNPGERITTDAIAQIEQRAADCPDTQFVLLGAGEGADALGALAEDITNGNGPIDADALAGTIVVDADEATEEQAAADKAAGITRLGVDESDTCEAEETTRDTHGLITSIHEALRGNPEALKEAEQHAGAATGSLAGLLGVVDPAKVGSIATNAAIMAEAPNPQSGAVLTADVLSVASAVSNVWHDDPNLPNLGDFADLLDPKTEIGKDLLAGLEDIAPDLVKELENGVAIARAIDTVGVDRVLELSSAIADQTMNPSPAEWEAIGKDTATILHTLGAELDDQNLIDAAETIQAQGADFNLDSLEGLEITPGEEAVTKDC